MCIGQCFLNLRDSFLKKYEVGAYHKLTFRKLRLAMEIFVVLLLAGINCVPGGHQQFQIWYMELIPLGFEMLGLPYALFYKLYYDVYPCRIHDPNKHHHVLLALAIALLTVGPGTLEYLFCKKRPKSSGVKKVKQN
mmetsp:Transcript_1105/g.2032  ORF Transcript_1105/g.2032 Transcript_1105/m.2032 type:complete len:136 (+) Transcript_1105:2132-2539(+)